MKYDIAVAHRVSPKLATSAIGFPDKLSMVSATTQSLFNALENLSVHFLLILDGCPEEYKSMIEELAASRNNLHLEIIQTPAIGNQATFELQINLLANEKNSKFLYFSEDDYLYRPEAFTLMQEALSDKGFDFVTPLDHPDLYGTFKLKDQPHELRIVGNSHWRRASTACLTFMTKPDVLRDTKDILVRYSRGCIDQAMWMGLTGKLIWNPLRLIWAWLAYLFHKKTNLSALRTLGAIKYLHIHLLRLHNFSLYTPIPTLSVHLCKLSLPFGSSLFFSADKRNEILACERSYLATMP